MGTLELLIIILVFISTLALSLSLIREGFSTGNVVYRHYHAWRYRPSAFWPSLSPLPLTKWRLLLGWAGWHGPEIKLSTTIIFSLLCTVILFLLRHSLAVLLFLICLASLFITLKIKATKRKAEFREQLPEALSSLSDALRSGFSLSQALIFISREVRPPLQEVLKALIRSEQVQLPLHEAFTRISRQIQIPEWTIIAEALTAQERWGGNILPLLEETAKTIRERLTVEKEILTLTAAGRLSGLLVSALAPIILLFFFIVSPDYLSAMFTTHIGRLLFILALGLQLVGFIWIRYLTQVDY